MLYHQLQTSAIPTSTDDMLRLLTELFSKVASVMTEKTTESKAKLPKFSGNPKKFRSWYLALMTQLSIAPWREFYDSARNDVVTFTTNTSPA
jgi:hypothetical protein